MALDQYPDGLPAILNPLYVTLLLSAYLAFVYKWGPQFMEKRKPFGLRKLMIAYNAIQVVANLYLFIGVRNLISWLSYLYICLSNRFPLKSSNTAATYSLAWKTRRRSWNFRCSTSLTNYRTWLRQFSLFFAKRRNRFHFCTFTIMWPWSLPRTSTPYVIQVELFNLMKSVEKW